MIIISTYINHIQVVGLTFSSQHSVIPHDPIHQILQSSRPPQRVA